MAITFGVATTTELGRTGNGDISVTLPTNWAVGDYAVMWVYNDQGDASTPTDWSEISGSPFGAGTEKMCVFTKFLVSGEATPTTTISGSGTNISHCATILTYRGVSTSSPLNVIGTASNGTGTPMTAGGVTTTVNGCVAIQLCGRGDNETASNQSFNASTTGVTERVDQGTSAGSDSQNSAADKWITSAGATGNASSDTSITDPWVSVVIALAPGNNVRHIIAS